MLKLDNNLLDELGLGSLPEDQKRSMLQHIYDTLELRVGTNLANQMTDQQLEEFEKFIDDGGDANQAQALQWLEANLPNYKQVVNDVFEQLKVEVRQMAPQIVAASGASSQQTAQAQPQQPPVQSQPMGQPMPQAPAPAPMPGSDPMVYQPPTPQAPAPQQPFQNPAPTPQPPQQGQDAQVYQFPTQQPPAGPGGYQQPPQYPGGQQAA